MTAPLDGFFARQDFSLLERLNGWRFQRDEDLVFWTFPARDGERYRVRFACAGYPLDAPGVRFVDAEGQSQDPRAWPAGSPRFHEVVKLPPNSFLCLPLTLEGLEHHRNWVGNAAVNAWDPKRHTLLDLCNFLQRWLNGADYLRRAA